MFLHLALPVFLKRYWLVKKTGFVGEGMMERVHWQRTVCEIQWWQFLCVCMCVCGFTHRSHSHPSPLHVSLFILQSFGHLTKTNDSASEMSSSPGAQTGWKRRRERCRGRDGEKALQSRPVPLFSVWLCPLAWRFEIDLRTHQTWIHGYRSTWNETSIKLCFILNQSCWPISSWYI